MKNVTEKRAKTMRKNAISWRVLSLMLCALMVFGNFGSVGSLVYAEDTTQVTDENPAPVDETANEANKANEANEATNIGGGSPEGADAEAPREEEAEDPVSYSSGSLTSKAKDYEIKVTYDEAAKVPDGSSLKVEEISDEDKYNEYVENAAAKVFENEDTDAVTLPYARFFDITILSPTGDVVAPASPVSVQIDLKDNALKTEDVTFSAVHFTEEEKNSTTEIVSTDIVEVTTDNVVAFDADTFSVYGVVYYYTVDFYYENKEAHLFGESSMLLSDLFIELGINKNTADIVSLEFTDTTLVRFDKEGSDYRIVSLQPFHTHELLSILFADGESIEIQVEDLDRTIDNNWYWYFNETTNVLQIRLRNNDTDMGLSRNINSANAWKEVWTKNGADIRSKVKKVEFIKNNNGREFDFNGYDTAYMFNGFTSLEEIDFSGVKDGAKVGGTIRNMFSGCSKLTGTIDLSWMANDSKVYDMKDMFSGCSSVEKIILNNESFKTRPVSNDRTSGGVQMQRMFEGCTSLKEVDMSNITLTGGRIYSGGGAHSDWKTAEGLFNGLSSLETITMDNTIFDGVVNFSNMASNCPSLTTVSMKGVDVSKAVTMNGMFQNSFTNPTGEGTPTLDVSGFGTLNSIVNMDDFVKGCTSLKVLNISNLDNSRIEPQRDNHWAGNEDEGARDVGNDWGREYGLETCTSLEWLIADNSKAWMTTNKKGNAGEEYFDASEDGDLYFFTKNQMGYYTSAPADLESPGAANTTIATKRDYIDVMTARFETGERGNDGHKELDTNKNKIVKNKADENGNVYLGAGTYHLLNEDWEKVTPPYQETYYRIGNIANSDPIVTTNHADLNPVDSVGRVDTKTYTKDDWNAHTTIENNDGSPVISVVYPAAAVDVNGKYHDVIVKVNKIEFTNLGSIINSPGRQHDSNRYVNTYGGGEYFRPVLQVSKGKLSFKNYVLAPADRKTMIKGDSGTNIDFTIEIKDALPNTSVLFYIDDLDVPASQSYDQGKNPNGEDDQCYDTLLWEKVDWDDYSEGVALGDGNDLATLQFAKHTGLKKDGNYVHATGGDPSSADDTKDGTTGWSAFSVKADADRASYTWKSGIGCTTDFLQETPTSRTLEAVNITPVATKMVNNVTPLGTYATKFEFQLVAAGEIPKVEYEYTNTDDGKGDRTVITSDYYKNNNDDKVNTVPDLPNLAGSSLDPNTSKLGEKVKNNGQSVTFDQLTFAWPKSTTFNSDNGVTGANVTNEPSGDVYSPSAPQNISFEDSVYNEHIARAYVYRVKEVIPADADEILEYNTTHVTYYLKVIVSNPKDDMEVDRGVKAEVYLGRYYAATNVDLDGTIEPDNIIWDDEPQVIWSDDSEEKGKRQQEVKTIAWPKGSTATGDQYEAKVDGDGVQYVKIPAEKYDPNGKAGDFVYLDATNPYSGNISVLQETKVGEVYPYDEQSSVYQEKHAHGDKTLSKPAKIGTAQVYEDVHGKKYIQDGDKYYVATKSGDAYIKGAELEVKDGTDGDFNPNPSTDKQIQEDWVINGNPVKEDINGVNYYQSGTDYINVGEDPDSPKTTKFEDKDIGKFGNVTPTNADKDVMRDKTSDERLIVTHTDGYGYPALQTSDKVPYYQVGSNYYSLVGTQLTSGQNGFNPTGDDEYYETKFNIFEDENGTLYYKSDGAYYTLDGEKYTPSDTSSADRTIVDAGMFNNRVKVSDISISKKAVDKDGNDSDKAGVFTYEIEFVDENSNTPVDINLSEKDYQFTPASDGTLTKSGTGKYTFTLTDDQTLTIFDVPFYTTYKITEKVTENGWEFVSASQWNDSSAAQEDQTASSQVNGTINVEKWIWNATSKKWEKNSDYTEQYDHTFKNRFTEVLVTKKVVDGPQNEGFTFTAEISGLTPNKEFTYGWMDKSAGNKYKFEKDTAGADGKATKPISFTLKHDEDISIVVPLNAKVKITETENNKFSKTTWSYDGTPAVTNKEGRVTDEITVGDDLKKVTFTNKAEADLEITKTWNDSEYSESPAKDIGNANEYKRQKTITVNIEGEYTVTEKVGGVDKEVTKEVTLTDAQKTATLAETTSWKAIVKGLPVYKEGQKVKYTVTEVPIDGFTSKPVTAEANFDSKEKKWIAEAKVKNTPVKVDKFNTITLHIKKTDSVFGGGLSEAQFTIKDADDKVVGTTNSTGNAGETHFDFTAPGVYTVSETKVPDGYVKHNDFKIQVDQKLKSITLVDGGTNASNNKVWQWLYDLLFGKKGEDGIDITETETGGTKSYSVTVPNDPIKAKITVTKVWNDANDQDGLRKKAADASKLPKVKLQVTEKGVPTDADWQDVSGVTGITAQDISVPVDGGVVKETAANNYTWNNLPAYKNGVLLRYRVVEQGKIEGYKDPSYQAEDESYERFGFALVEPGTTTAKDRTLTITNEYTPKVAKLKTIKIWVDGNNQDGTRTKFIDVKLTSNADKPAGAGDEWKNEWNVRLENVSETSLDNEVAGQWPGTVDLPVYQNQGTPIEYTLKEIIPADGTLKNYTQIYEGKSGDASVKVTGNDIKFTLEKADKGIYTVKITNKYEPKKANIKVTKEWKDGNDHAGLRAKAGDNMPKVYLEWTTKPADGVWRPISELDLVTGVSDVSVPKNGGIAEGTAGSGVTWKDMPVYKDGDTIYYRVRENNQIEGYEASYSSTYSSSHDYFALVHAAGGTHVVQDGEVKVINRYSAPYTLPKGYMNIQKTLTGRDWKESDEFSFGLFSLGSAPMPDDVTDTQGVMHEDISIKIDDDTKLTDETETYTDKQGFGAITYTADKLYKNPDGSLKPTTFVYAIRELTAAETGKPRITGITYSGARYRAYVTIGPDEDTNALDLIDFHYVDMTTGQKLDKGKIPEFINKYDPNETTYLMVAEKQFEHYGSDNDLEDGKYEFVLKPIGKLADHAPMPEGSTGIGASRTYTQKNSGHRIVFGDNLDDLDGLVFNYTALREDLERVYDAEGKDIDEAFEEGIHFEYEIYEKIPEGFTNAGDGTYNKVTETADEHYMEVYDGIHHTRMITVKVVTNDNGTPNDATDDFHELEVTASSDDHTGDFYYTSGANENGTGRTTLTDRDVYEHAHGTGGMPMFHNEVIPLRNLEIIKEWEDGDFYSDGNAFNGQVEGYERPNVTFNVVGTGKDRNDETVEVYRKEVTLSGDQEGTHKWTAVQLTDLPEYVGEYVPGLHTHDIKDNEVNYTVEEIVPAGFEITNGNGSWDTENDKLWSVTFKNAPKKDSEYEPRTITIKKVDHNTKNGLAGATFKVTKADDSEYSKVTEATSADGTVEFTFDTPGSYTIKEETVPKGYKKSDEEYKVVWEPEFKSAALDNESDKWMRTYTLEFNEVESTELQGDAETGYTLTVENTAISAILTVTKTWDDGNNRDGKRVATRAHLQRKLGEDGTWEDMHRPNSSELWAPVRTDYENNHGQVNTAELYAYVDGKVAYYRVVENPLPGYTTTYDAADGVYASEGKGVSLLDESDETGMTAVDRTLDIKNSYTPETVYIKVTKAWDDADFEGIEDYARQDIKIKVTAKAGSTELKASDLGLTDEDLVKTISADAEGEGLTVVFENLPRRYNPTPTIDDSHMDITYSVEEEVPSIWTKSGGTLTEVKNSETDEVEGYEATFTNTPVDGEEKEVTRTITYTYIDENGNTAVASKEQKLTLRRMPKAVDPETGKVTEWYDWKVKEDEFKDGFPEVKSPEYDAADSSTSGIKGWKATKSSTPKMSLEDIVKGLEEGTSEFEENIPYETTPATDTGETKDVLYESVGEVKDQSWTPSNDFMDEIEGVVVPDGKGTPNEVEEFVLVDESGKEVPSITTDEGTYVIDNETGKVTFTPKEGFTGKASTVTVRAKDKVGKATGKYPEAKYTPEVVDNLETKTVTRTITYTYIDKNGNTAVASKQQKMTLKRIGKEIDLETGEVTEWGDWEVEEDEFKDGFPEVESPEYSSSDSSTSGIKGWKATKASTPKMSLEDVVKGLEEGTSEFEENIPYVTTPATETGETKDVLYEPDGDIKDQTWAPSKDFLDEVEGVVVPDGKGTPNEVEEFVLVDESGNEVPSITTDEGTYTIDKGTGKVTFTPKEGFTGKASTVTVRAKDKVGAVTGKYPEAKYTPEVVNNRKSTTATRRITYTYLTPDGEEVTNAEVQSLDFDKYGVLDPENPDADDNGLVWIGSWIPRTGDTFPAIESPVVDEWIADRILVPAFKVLDPEGTTFEVHVVYQTAKEPSVDPTPEPKPTPKDDPTPRTGDESNAALWIGILAAAVCLVAILFFMKKRNKDDDNSTSNPQ